MKTVSAIVTTHAGLAAAGGLLAGTAWLSLTPKGQVVPQNGYLYAVDDPETIARQDGVFLLCIATVAIFHTAWFLTSKPKTPTLRWRFIAGVFAACLGTAVAWAVGYFGGPTQLALTPGTGERFDAPFDVHARALLFTWPFLFAFVACLRWSFWDISRWFRKPAVTRDEATTTSDND